MMSEIPPNPDVCDSLLPTATLLQFNSAHINHSVCPIYEGTPSHGVAWGSNEILWAKEKVLFIIQCQNSMKTNTVIHVL